MAYSFYVDDNDPFTPASTDSITWQQWREMQKQCARMLGPREISLFPRAMVQGSTADWQNTGPTVWTSTTDDGVLIFPIELRYGSVIHGAHVIFSGTTGVTNGLMQLIARPIGGGSDVTVDIKSAKSNPWDTGGIAYANSDQFIVFSDATGLPMTVYNSTYYYFIKMQAPDNVTATGTVNLWYVSIIASTGTAP